LVASRYLHNSVRFFYASARGEDLRLPQVHYKISCRVDCNRLTKDSAERDRQGAKNLARVAALPGPLAVATMPNTDN